MVPASVVAPVGALVEPAVAVSVVGHLAAGGLARLQVLGALVQERVVGWARRAGCRGAC